MLREERLVFSVAPEWENRSDNGLINNIATAYQGYSVFAGIGKEPVKEHSSGAK